MDIGGSGDVDAISTTGKGGTASSGVLKALRSELAVEAQAEYDLWTPLDGDLDGFAAEYGGGGICHLVAGRIAHVVGCAGIEAHVVDGNQESHTYCLAVYSDGIFEVDVPHRLYETGACFRWTRIEGVSFTGDDVSVTLVDRDVGNARLYLPEADEAA